MLSTGAEGWGTDTQTDETECITLPHLQTVDYHATIADKYNSQCYNNIRVLID